jgi:hypothetical protein
MFIGVVGVYWEGKIGAKKRGAATRIQLIPMRKYKKGPLYHLEPLAQIKFLTDSVFLLLLAFHFLTRKDRIRTLRLLLTTTKKVHLGLMILQRRCCLDNRRDVLVIALLTTTRNEWIG